jgi:hypothetical protein
MGILWGGDYSKSAICSPSVDLKPQFDIADAQVSMMLNTSSNPIEVSTESKLTLLQPVSWHAAQNRIDDSTKPLTQ